MIIKLRMNGYIVDIMSWKYTELYLKPYFSSKQSIEKLSLKSVLRTSGNEKLSIISGDQLNGKDPITPNIIVNK